MTFLDALSFFFLQDGHLLDILPLHVTEGLEFFPDSTSFRILAYFLLRKILRNTRKLFRFRYVSSAILEFDSL